MHDRMLQFFQYKHLPPHLALVSQPFCELAEAIVNGGSGDGPRAAPLPQNPERTVALRKLLEAKDAAVRCVLEGA